VRFGVIADCQYADADTRRTRYYRESLAKLEACVADLNREQLDFVAHLGDLIDRDPLSFDAVLPILARSRAPVRHVLGNHDIPTGRRAWSAERLGMPAPYYSFRVRHCRFFVLDGNEVSVFATPAGSGARREAEAWLERLQSAGAPWAQAWNGGISETQLAWLRGGLRGTREAGETAVVLCHFPVYPDNPHNLWNAGEVREVVSNAGCVAAYLNGHNHAGLYATSDGIPFLTLPGMVETESTTAYGITTQGGPGLTVTGTGRTPDYPVA
jgi:3',5'-cyclic AMP phosphodiesterase CpdA